MNKDKKGKKEKDIVNVRENVENSNIITNSNNVNINKNIKAGRDISIDQSKHITNNIYLEKIVEFRSASDVQGAWTTGVHMASPDSRLVIFPFDGRSLDAWIGWPMACWQAVDEQILGMGSDLLAFPETPAEDLKACSLLIWEGLRFHDGSAKAHVWLPTLYQRPGAAGLVLRHMDERTAILGLLRHSPADGGGSLELWRRSGMSLEEIKSCPLPLNAGCDGWYDLSLEICDQQASIRVGQSDQLSATLPAHLPEGYFGLLKFSGTVVRFSNLRLEVSTNK